MKLNKKGFVLAEVVIVASVIAGLLITLYIALNRISFAYETRNKYYDIDAMEAAMEVNDLLIRESFFDGNELDYSVLSDEIVDITNLYYLNTNYNLIAHYITSRKDVMEDLILNTQEGYFREYLNYLNDNIIFDDYSYLIIVELIDKEDEDNYRFYTLKVAGEENETE